MAEILFTNKQTAKLNKVILDEIQKAQLDCRAAFRQQRRAQYLEWISSNTFNISNLQTIELKPKLTVDICSEKFNQRIIQLLRDEQAQKSSAQLESESLIKMLQKVWKLSSKTKDQPPKRQIGDIRVIQSQENSGENTKTIKKDHQRFQISRIAAQTEKQQIRNVTFIQSQNNSVEHSIKSNKQDQASQIKEQKLNNEDSHEAMQQQVQSKERQSSASQDPYMASEDQILAKNTDGRQDKKREKKVQNQSSKINQFVLPDQSQTDIHTKEFTISDSHELKAQQKPASSEQETMYMEDLDYK